jgi:hypothetical protein
MRPHPCFSWYAGLVAPQAPRDKCRAGGVLGVKNPRIKGSGPYAVCLNDRQAEDIFGPSGRPKRKLGSGTFASAYETDAGRVVKITKDRDDVDALVGGQGISRVAKVYRHIELGKAGKDVRTGKPVPVYALEVEKLGAVSPKAERLLSRPLEMTRVTLLRDLHRTLGGPETYAVPQEMKHAMINRACGRMRNEVDRSACSRFVGDYTDAFVALAHRGIVWQDSHFGNIGVDSGNRWKALDLGYSRMKKHVAVPTLNGPAIRRR